MEVLIWVVAILAAGVLIPTLVVKPVWGLYVLLLLVTVVPPRGVVSILDNHLMPVDLYMVLFTLLWVWHKGITGASPRISRLLVDEGVALREAA